MAEVELHVVCKHCGAEVSPYITECPYCGHRLRKRAPKLESRGEELAPKEKRRLFKRKRHKAEGEKLGWLGEQRPYATIALVLAGAVMYVIDRSGTLGIYDLGALIFPLDDDYWRLVATQFIYLNLGYLFAVGFAVAVFGTSLERRYGLLVVLAIFLGAGAAGAYLTNAVETIPLSLGGNGAALGLLAAWTVRELRGRRDGAESETDLLGVGVIAAVLVLMPLAVPTASWMTAAGGVAFGSLAGLILPERR